MIKPLFDLVLLERQKAERIGSIMVPRDMQKRHATLRCKVLAKGPNADESIPIGAEVLLGVHTGTWINANGRPVADEATAEFFMCQDKDILAVVEEDNADRGTDAGSSGGTVRALADFKSIA
jgi:co-chaperonin GroES (HSP10)